MNTQQHRRSADRHRRGSSASHPSRGAAAAGLPPYLADPHHALDQRDRAVADVLQRPADLQRAPEPVLGQPLRSRQGTAGARPRGTDRNGNLVGITRVGKHEFITTGVLGVSNGPDGTPTGARLSLLADRARPAAGWRWGAAGISSSPGSSCSTGSATSAIRWRASTCSATCGRPVPTGAASAAPSSTMSRFKHPHGEEALRYNILQQLAYLTVMFVFGVGIVLMGLAMSPRLDAVLSPDGGGRRRPPVGAHDPFHHCLGVCGVRRHPPVRGADQRRLQPAARHDHRLLQDRRRSRAEPPAHASVVARQRTRRSPNPSPTQQRRRRRRRHD